MIYLLDTNIISETIKSAPNERVISWLKEIDIMDCSLSVLTLGEIRKGAAKLEHNAKKQKIIQWLEITLPKQFNGRIIDINQQVSDKWGYITSFCGIPAVDGLLAASAVVYNQKLVTRNVKDFTMVAGLEIINPWVM